MKLTLEQLKTTVSGAAEITEKDGVFRLARFTAAHQAAAFQTGTGAWRRSESESSICLDLVTDATALCFTQCNAWISTARPFFCFDLYINGTLCDHRGYLEDGPIGSFRRDQAPSSFRFDLREGTKRVTLYLPEMAHVELKDVELENASVLQPWSYEGTLVAFGDSITEGHDVRFAGMDYIDQLSRLLNYKLYNFGIGGDRFGTGVLKGEDFPRADLVTVALGTNDFRHSTGEEFEAAAKAFFARLHEIYPQTPVAVITPLWRKLEESGTAFEAGTMAQIREFILRECFPYENFTVVPGEGLIPHHPDFFWDKALHPNDLGHTHYAMNLYRFLVKNVL